MCKFLLCIGVTFFTHQIFGQESDLAVDSESENESQTCESSMEDLEDAARRIELLEKSEISAQDKLLLVRSLPPTQSTAYQSCAYTRSNTSKISRADGETTGTSTTERYTPVGDAATSWSLLGKDGSTPSIEDLEIYELVDVVSLRSNRSPPWFLETALPLDALEEVQILEGIDKVVFKGRFSYLENVGTTSGDPIEIKEISKRIDSDEVASDLQDVENGIAATPEDANKVSEGEFAVTLIINTRTHRLEKYLVELLLPFQINELMSLSQYELSQDWTFNDDIGRNVLRKSQVIVVGRSHTEDFSSISVNNTSAFFCPSEDIASEDAFDPCLEGTLDTDAEAELDLLPNPVQERLSEPI